MSGTGFEQRLLCYLRACVEAETDDAVVVARDARTRVLLNEGEAPLLGELRLPDDPEARRWAGRCVSGQGTALAGWPVVSDMRRLDGRPRSVLAPLLYTEVRVGPHGRGFVCEPTGGWVEISRIALVMLGVPADEAERLCRAAEELAGRPTMAEVVRALVALVAEAGVEGIERLDPHRLGPLREGERLHGTGILFFGDGDRSAFTRAVLEDLEALGERPVEQLRAGPLGVLLGTVSPDPPVLPRPLPVAVAANAEQEHAVACALDANLTVVTGPPGTGKTQVLVNVAAAAVAAGRTVLLASKNNHAIDVVAERLRELNAEAAPVRTGRRDHRAKAAGAIRAALARPTVPPGESVGCREEWEQLRRSVQPAYDRIAELERLQRRLDEASQALAAHLATLPAALARLDGAVEREIVVAAHQAAVRHLDECDRFRPRLFGRRRWRRLREQADAKVRGVVALFGGEAHTELTDALLREGPRACLARIADVLRAEELRERVARARTELELAPSWEGAWAAVDAALVGRHETGNRLVAAAWRERLRAAPPTARAAAHAYAEKLDAGRPSAARAVMRPVLQTFPVWATTSLAAGTNFPLEPGLFDLVVIDEASQSDLASAIPLLFRARRALVVGDPNQLTHICTLAPARDRHLARSCGLTDEEHGRFSYRSTSLFGAAVHAARRDPLLLRQHFRSHPDVIGFANREIYGGRLVVCTPERHLGGPAFQWQDCEGPWERGPAGSSVRKPREADHVIETLRLRAQVELLRDLLAERLAHLLGHVTIDTAHGFQGDERDVMIFSPAVGPDLLPRSMQFAGDRNLVNVAVTRARSRLVVVGDHAAALGSGTLLAALAQYATDLRAVRAC